MYFPNYQIHSFYDNPDEIVNYSKSLNFEKSDTGRYPGTRSQSLHEINDDLFTYSCQKILKSIYGPSYKEVSFIAQNYFQLINPNHLKENENQGWIHVDPDSILTAIIYLSKDVNRAGTSLYTAKSEGKGVINSNSELRKQYYLDGIVAEDYKEKLIENNDRFEKLATFYSKYNSMVAFDGSNFHGANFDLQNETRLTQIIFFYEINANYYPYPEIRKPF